MSNGYILDNGQHIMLGAYHFTREIFELLGLKETNIFHRCPLELKLFSTNEKPVHLKAPSLPAPLHLLFSLISIKGLSLDEKLKVIIITFKLYSYNFKLKKDLTVEQLLSEHNQTPKLIKALWEPLCLATMNTPVKKASAEIFLNVLKDSFTKKRQDSDLFFFRQDLTQTFCKPAIQFIKDNDSSIYFADKVIRIKENQHETEAKFSIHTKNKIYHSDQVVLACPASITEKLLSDAFLLSCLKPEQASLNFFYEPIYTIYIQYPAHIKLPYPMVGFFSCKLKVTSQWAIDRSLMGQAGLIAVVISGSGEHTQMTSEQIIVSAHKEIGFVIPHLPDFLEYKIIKEKKATFSCRVNISQQRPATNTSVSGLYLAGDYTNTGYPATLEGAIKSGVLAAREIIQSKTVPINNC